MVLGQHGSSREHRERGGVQQGGPGLVPGAAPVGDVLRQVELAEGGQQALHPLLKALGRPRVPRRRDDGHMDVAAAGGANSRRR